ncbi:nuclear transport factor 2 family protein [Pseudoalteromonas sp. MMG013]|uniref:DUF4440 domain-containing protein n=1 Tax=Pseudoalteromonas aurantia 208 TaxID=1314867 RepID=A0ABR9ELA3_9GAMM|nr:MULTISPECIES: DUF4440 domain-containing protein [Pseudoalteromonas]MBE0371030.1 hypothetical protein [Pseudoalteromonas aurantia 208]MBQ4847244.1 nuclear transport factor 2 family protein [Pseudoalteromonas sp. MMG005]MBQ4860146.1 nuclear transport factor 2 family protein [Pseudoalteromonas sp. MMG013]
MTTKISESLLEHLVELERILLEPSVRQSVNRLDQLLSPNFHEISANGLMFNKAHIMSRLPSEKVPQFYNQSFIGQMLSADIAQLTYHAAYRHSARAPLHYSIRMSIWKKVAEQWQLIYHQGTPCPEFALQYE